MSKIVQILLMILIVTGFGLAQTQQPTVKGGEALLRNLDQQLRVARDLLRVFPNKQAEKLVRQAYSLRNEALSLASSKRDQLAKTKLLTALNLTKKAVNMLSQVPVERIREQVEELILRAEQLVAGRGNKEAERLLRDAKNNIKFANKALHSGDYLAAMEHFRVAKFLAERSMSLVRGPQLNPEEQIRSERARFEQLMRRAEEAVADCGNAQAEKMVRQVQKQVPVIRQAVNNGNLRFALNLYYSSTRLLLRAIDICQGQRISLREQAIEEIALLEDLLTTAREAVDESTSQRNRMLVEKAERLHQQAQRAMNNGRFEVALRRVELARNLLSRIWLHDEAPSLRQRADEELRRLEADIARIEDQRGKLTKRDRALIRAARMSARDARRFLRRGRISMALEAILAGNRFLSALDVRAPAIDEERINAEYERLSQKLDRIAEQAEPEDQDIIEAARKMLDRAREAALDGNYELAMEYLKLGFDLLKKIR